MAIRLRSEHPDTVTRVIATVSNEVCNEARWDETLQLSIFPLNGPLGEISAREVPRQPLPTAQPPGAQQEEEVSGDPLPVAGSASRRQPLSRRGVALRAVVVAVALLDLVATCGLVVQHLRPGWFAAMRNVSPTPMPARLTTPRQPRATQSATTATLLDIVPDRGRPGTLVEISGRDLFSSSGSVVAQFGGIDARTRCASDSRCTVTVPSERSGAITVGVVVQLGAAHSNMLRFSYVP